MMTWSTWHKTSVVIRIARTHMLFEYRNSSLLGNFANDTITVTAAVESFYVINDVITTWHSSNHITSHCDVSSSDVWVPTAVETNVYCGVIQRNEALLYWRPLPCTACHACYQYDYCSVWRRDERCWSSFSCSGGATLSQSSASDPPVYRSQLPVALHAFLLDLRISWRLSVMIWIGCPDLTLISKCTDVSDVATVEGRFYSLC